MKSLLFILFIITHLPLNIMQGSPFSSYQWKNRILVIYADDAGNTNYEQQLSNFEQHKNAYENRDMLVLKISGQFIYQLPQNQMLNISASQAISFLSIDENDSYQVSLIGKDGGIKLKSRSVISNQKLFATIDAMPMRQNELDKD